MPHQRIWFSLLALLLTALPAQASDLEAPAEASTDSAASPLSGFELYAAEQFQIQVPSGSQVAVVDAGKTIITSPGLEAVASSSVETEIQWAQQPPGQLVPAALEDIEAQGYAVRRYQTLVVDGVTALRLWLAEIPNQLPYATVTFVGYEDSTVVLTSRYGEPGPEVDSLLTALHGSFTAFEQ